MPYDISEERRLEYRRVSSSSQTAKRLALQGRGPTPLHAVNVPRLDPASLMPARTKNGLRSLSLFSGGGGLDLGFDLAGYNHVASYEILDVCGETIQANRSDWEVHTGPSGDVRTVDWSPLRDAVEVVHGGPPCQPFSAAGKQTGGDDDRNMWPEFIRAVLTIRPRAFVAENVQGLLSVKFQKYVHEQILAPLAEYTVFQFSLHAAMFGVPQSRKRVFFVGFLDKRDAASFREPGPTHTFRHLTTVPGSTPFPDFDGLPRCMGVREALGLPNIGIDGLAPTLRSGFTGPRNSTSVLNSVAGQRTWEALGIWPNGVGLDRQKASLFTTSNGHFRLSVQDCAIIQGFPEYWRFAGGVYKILGQIGNSVAPPVAFRVALAVSGALSSDSKIG